MTQEASYKAYIAGLFDRAAPTYGQTDLELSSRAGALLVDAARLSLRFKVPARWWWLSCGRAVVWVWGGWWSLWAGRGRVG